MNTRDLTPEEHDALTAALTLARLISTVPPSARLAVLCALPSEVLRKRAAAVASLVERLRQDDADAWIDMVDQADDELAARATPIAVAAPVDAGAGPGRRDQDDKQDVHAPERVDFGWHVGPWQVSGPVTTAELAAKWPEARTGDSRGCSWFMCINGDDRRVLLQSETIPTLEAACERMRTYDDGLADVCGGCGNPRRTHRADACPDGGGQFQPWPAVRTRQ